MFRQEVTDLLSGTQNVVWPKRG